MTGMSRGFCLLTGVARIDVVLDEGIDTWKPIIPSYQFEGSGDTAVTSERSVMMLYEHVHAQGSWNVDEAFVKQQVVAITGPRR